MRVLIVGGVAGGASTAAKLRRLDEKAEIIMFERGAEISYANCGIPYHIGNVIKDRKQLTIVSQEDFENMFNVRVRTLSEVISIDRAKKTIKVKDLQKNETYEESYDKLVLSPGGSPIRPPISGIECACIFTVRSLADMDAIKNYIDAAKPKKALVVGAGFIGLELAENLAGLGMLVSIVELAGQVMNLMDFEMAAIIHQHLKNKKVELYLNDGVKEFVKDAGCMTAVLQSGRKIKSDVIILSIGVKPEVMLAKDSGMEIGKLGGIKVDKYLRTSDPDIFALGDAAETNDLVCDCPALVPLANASNKQGRVVAENILGGKEEYAGTPGTAIAKVFDLTAAITGSSEKVLRRHGMKYDKVFLIPSSHAGYYPDAFPMTLKLLYDPADGRVLGGQIVGLDGVDKRIDVISVMVQLKRTVHDLAAQELAYAPPYSSAKDPVNLAGMVAINQMKNRNIAVFWDEVVKLKEDGALFLDVRSPLEFDLSHIEGAVNIPLVQIRKRLADIPKDRKVVVYCNQGKTAYFALTILLNSGYKNAVNLSGGFKVYSAATAKQENTGIFENMVVLKAEDIMQVAPGTGKILEIDAGGLQCPGPVMALANKIKELNVGDIVRITATDPGFKNDIGVWCEKTGNILASLKDENRHIIAEVQKGRRVDAEGGPIPHDKTIVLFSGDLDKALAAFVIANGALSMGRKVTIFFTFWGLNVLRKPKGPSVSKGLLDRMFGMMMPKGTGKLGLSRMNMAGIGPILIRHVMKSKNINSLEELLGAARMSGIKLLACQMSMDVMGIKKEELIDGIEIGGVANYLGSAEDADTNLFI